MVSTIETDHAESPFQTVRIMINGEDLLVLVREYERVFAEKEGHPDLAGGYVNERLEHLKTKLQDPEKWPFAHDNEVAVLVCSCREEGCWPLMVSITRTDETVTWSHFRQPHRHEQSPASYWDYAAFGPFVFETVQYDTALSLLG